MKKSLIILFFLWAITMACGSKNKTVTAPAPTNLEVTAVVNPNNSGNVSFTAKATNANNYNYDFGNGGVAFDVLTGNIDYKYSTSGNYTVTVKALNAAGQSISKTINITVNVVQTLVWADEFNTPGAPDPTKWGYDLGAGGWGNNEPQYYTNRPENVIVSNGTLKITVKKENYNGSPYTSTRMITKDKYAFKYGKVEVRAKMPEGVGTWPAIWMLGSNISTVNWPACGEIDICEHLGRELNKIYGTLHYPGRSGGNANGGYTFITGATTEFHKYTLEWNEATIKIAVDDKLFHTVTNSASIPFNQNFFLILNVAIGGNFGGTIDPAFVSSSMEVDYVRVYQ
jgi:beta-glucanase (GH16 family)